MTSTIDLYQTPPPELGSRELLSLYFFEPGYINLNNGSYGALPRPVYDRTDALARRIESNPDLFHRWEFQEQLRTSRSEIAQLIGAQENECVLVQNASTGINTVLRNFEWAAEDVLVVFATTYGSVSRTAAYISDTVPHPTISRFNVHYPMTHAALIASFQAHIRSLRSSKSRKIVAVIDSIISMPGVLLPWKELVSVCKNQGVWSVVDAAHSIGQEVGLDLTKAAPDFWVSNCHKWLSCKRSCAVMYVPLRNQHLIRTSFPTSEYYAHPPSKTTFVDQFTWSATIDFAPSISVSFALEFRKWIGGETAINDYCHNLAIAGGHRMAAIFDTEVFTPFGKDGPGVLNMVNVRLPLPSSVAGSADINEMMKTKLMREHNVSAPGFYFQNQWWVRCSAQVWNNMEDFEKAARSYLVVCAEVVEEVEGYSPRSRRRLKGRL